MTMNCIKCKKEIPDGAAYCNFCGKKQPSEDAPKRKGRTVGNGQGSVYKRGRTWVAQTTAYVNEDRIVKRKGGFLSKAEAVAHLSKLRNKRKESRLAELWDVYKGNALLDVAADRQSAYKAAYKRLKAIHASKMCDITIESIQTCVNEKAISFETARNMKIVLSHLYKMAMAQQEVTVNLAQFIKLPKVPDSKATAFTDDELKRIWKYYKKDKSTGYIILMIYSGMMPGELLQCKKDMINFETQQIIGCGMKTKKRRETPIVIADIILPIVKDLCELSDTDRLVNMNEKQFAKWFQEKMKQTRCRKELRPYACRHTTATALALGNEVAPSVIQEIMRHSKITTTQQYIHPDTSSMLAGVNKLKKQ